VSIAVPKTNFIDLLHDVIDALEESIDRGGAPSSHKDLLRRVHIALRELEEL
jgi:hypothetical protein